MKEFVFSVYFYSNINKNIIRVIYSDDIYILSEVTVNQSLIYPQGVLKEYLGGEGHQPRPQGFSLKI